MLKFNTPSLKKGEFTAKITGLLPKGEDFWVKFKYRAGGNANPLFVAGLERIRHADLVSERVLSRIIDDAAYADALLKSQSERGRQWFGMIYDACVIEWETNILSDGSPIMPTRENFVELASSVFPQSLAQAMSDLQASIAQLGADALAVDEASIKN